MALARGPGVLSCAQNLGSHARRGAGQPVDPGVATPSAWREYAWSRTGESAPEWMTDGESAVYTPSSNGYDPADYVDRSIMATGVAVFPDHGLDPQP